MLLYWIFGALFVIITGLTVALILTWTALKEEQARSFNQRVFNRIVSMEKHPSQPDVLNHPARSESTYAGFAIRKAEERSAFFDQDAV